MVAFLEWECQSATSRPRIHGRMGKLRAPILELKLHVVSFGVFWPGKLAGMEKIQEPTEEITPKTKKW